MESEIWSSWGLVVFYFVMGILLWQGQNMIVMAMMVAGMFFEAVMRLVVAYRSRVDHHDQHHTVSM